MSWSLLNGLLFVIGIACAMFYFRRSGIDPVESLRESVPPIVTLLFALAIMWGWLNGRLSDDAFMGIAGGVVAYWFQRAKNTPNGETPAPSSTPQAPSPTNPSP